MKAVEEVLYDLVFPLVEDKEGLSVKRLPSLNDNEIILTVYATNADTARLIGRHGTMAHAIRQTMAIGSRVVDQKISVKFEAY